MNSVLRAGARILFGKLVPRLAYPVIRGPLKGTRFILGAPAGEAGGVSVYFNASEPEQTAVFANTVKKGQVFFDIGANVGYYTMLGSRIVGPSGKVFAFEPAIRNLAYLYRHAVLNRADNVTIIAAACSDAVSLAVFSTGSSCASGHITDAVQPADDGRAALFPTPTVTIDAVARQTGASPDVMKIDVEGAEYSVLKGAEATLRNAKPDIFLSTHSDKLRSDCLAYLKGLGYTCEVLRHDGQDAEFLATVAEK